MTVVADELERLFRRASAGDREAFADWMGRVERPIRLSLRRFARVVDVEAVVQETFLRMWILATRRPERRLEGRNASLRFAMAVGRNVALEEVRRARLGRVVSLEDLENPPEPAADPEPVRDHGLARAIRECIERLPARARSALLLRLREGHHRPDRDLAAEIGMKLNTFFQNIVRARRSLWDCLRGRGVPLEGLAP